MILTYVDFIASLYRISNFILHRLFFSNDYKKIDKIIYKHTDKYCKRKDFTLKKNEARNCFQKKKDKGI